MEMGLWFVRFPLKRLLLRFPLKLSYSLSHLFAWVFYVSLEKRRRIIKEEVTRLFGSRLDKKGVRRVARKSFDIFLKRQVENLLLAQFTGERLNRISYIDGIENLNIAMDKGNGVIMLLSHFGSFLLPLPVFSYMGFRVFQIVGKPLLEGRLSIHKKLFELKKKEMSALPVQFIEANNYMRPVVRALRDNGIIVIAFDGRTGDKWVTVRLLDRLAQFSSGPFSLAMMTGAAILPTFVVRNRYDKHRIILEPPITLEKANSKEQALIENIKKYVQIFEKYLLRYPCHFGMTLFTVRKEAETGLNLPLFVD
jgi:KDO2-lipid IV(A) lauroyltransferase